MRIKTLNHDFTHASLTNLKNTPSVLNRLGIEFMVVFVTGHILSSCGKPKRERIPSNRGVNHTITETTNYASRVSAPELQPSRQGQTKEPVMPIGPPHRIAVAPSPKGESNSLESKPVPNKKGSIPNLQPAKDLKLNDQLADATKKDDKETILALLRKGADPNAKVCKLGELHVPILLWAAKKLHVDIFDLALQMGADPNLEIQDDYASGKTILYDMLNSLNTVSYSSENKKNLIVEMVSKLLAKGANPSVIVKFNKSDEIRNCLLIFGIYEGASANDVLELLLDHGADPDQIGDNTYGHTALTQAADAGNVEKVKLFLKKGPKGSKRKGANPNAPNKYSTIPLVCALDGKCLDESKTLNMVQELSEHHARFDASPSYRLLGRPIGMGWRNLVKFLLEKGVKVEVKSLCHAVENDRLEILKDILAHKHELTDADIEQALSKSKNDTITQLLQEALLKNSTNVIK